MKTWDRWAQTLTQLAVLLLFIGVLAVANSAASKQAPASVIPIKGDRGDAAVVDYDKIDQMVAAKLAAIPQPTVAQPEAVDYQKVQAAIKEVVKQEVAKIPPAKDGKDGITLLNVEFSQDKGTNNVTWRCVGDTVWTLLKDNPVLKDSCS